MASGRQLFEAVLKRESAERPPYVPLLWRLVSRVAGTSAEGPASDASGWASALVRTADLLDVTVFFTAFEPATRELDLEGLQQLVREIRSTFA